LGVVGCAVVDRGIGVVVDRDFCAVVGMGICVVVDMGICEVVDNSRAWVLTVETVDVTGMYWMYVVVATGVVTVVVPTC